MPRGHPVLIHFSMEIQSVFRRPAARKSVSPGAGHLSGIYRWQACIGLLTGRLLSIHSI
jgi:hypothetical protein